MLTIVDDFSKYVVLRAVRDTTADETLIFIKEFICHYGRPTRIISDQGTAFTTAVFETFCREHFIIHVKVSSKSPRSNGQVEIVNGVAIKYLSTITKNSDNNDWHLRLVEVQWSLNNSTSRVTKCKPFDVIHRYSANGLAENPLISEIKQLNEKLGKDGFKCDPTISP